MVRTLYKIIFVLISCSFIISALEINIGKAHNTFFDEFDTYIKAEQVSVNHEVNFKNDFNNCIANILYSSKIALSNPKLDLNYGSNFYQTFPFIEKIFLKTTVLRI